MYLVWEELTVALPNFGNGPTRRLLDGVTGCAQPGRIMAIMGSSSSGKSTLLNALASFRLYPSPNLTTTILNIMAAFMSREYKYNRQAFNQKARSMTEKYAKAGAGESSCSYQCTETKVDSTMCAEESRQYGISGVLSYGLLNTIYYFITFLLVCSQQYMPSGSRAEAEVQRLRDQMAQMQATTIEQITQLKAEATSREAEVQKRYEELQLQLKADAAAREAEVQRKYEELQQQLKADAAVREAEAAAREVQAAAREAEAKAREAEAKAREAEQLQKFDELQQQLQSMMKMFQQSQQPPS